MAPTTEFQLPKWCSPDRGSPAYLNSALKNISSLFSQNVFSQTYELCLYFGAIPCLAILGGRNKKKKKHKNIYVTCLCYRAKSFVFGSISLNEGVSCGCQFSLLNSSHRVSACCFFFFLFWGKIPNRVIPPARC